MILTVAKDLFDGFRQPTILHSFFVDDTCDTSKVYRLLVIITLAQDPHLTILSEL